MRQSLQKGRVDPTTTSLAARWRCRRNQAARKGKDRQVNDTHLAASYRKRFSSRAVIDVKKNAARPQGWGVAKSLGYFAHGPVGLLHTHKVRIQSEKPTCVS
jgi:hypothetical protein